MDKVNLPEVLHFTIGKNPYSKGKTTLNPYIPNDACNVVFPSSSDFIIDAEDTLPKSPYESSVAYQMRTGAQMTCFTSHSQDFPKETKVLSASTGRQRGDHFLEFDSKLFFLQDGKEIPVSNFVIEITEIVCRKTLTESIDYLKIKLQSASSSEEVTIARSKFKSLLSEIKTACPQFRLNAAFRNASAIFSEYSSVVYEDAMHALPQSTSYDYAGWEKVDGKMVYLSDRLPYCHSSRYVWEIPPEDFCAAYLNGQAFLTVGNDMKTILPLFLYAHIGYSAQLFERAGSEVQFLLMLVGKTGSFKTSICKELFQAFNVQKFLNFQSTPRAIELQRNECRDMTLLLDDIFSSKDSDALRKFADVLRVFGDNASKAKANASATNIERFDVRGAAVVTGESDLNTQQSSRLRYLTIHVDNSSFNADSLRYFQDDRALASQENRPSIMQIYFSAYIQFLENFYDDVVREIMSVDQYLPPMKLNFPRLNMIYRIMGATAKIILRFGICTGAITPVIAENTFSTWLETIQSSILDNQVDSNTCDPHIAYLEAVMQCIATGEIPIAEDKSAFFQSSRDHFGFYDKRNYLLYLVPPKIYKQVEKYHSEMHATFNATPKDVHKVLYDQGLSEGYQEKNRNRYLKKVTYGDHSLQMLCLKITAVNNILN